jgi:hypothetical protein
MGPGPGTFGVAVESSVPVDAGCVADGVDGHAAEGEFDVRIRRDVSGADPGPLEELDAAVVHLDLQDGAVELLAFQGVGGIETGVWIPTRPAVG